MFMILINFLNFHSYWLIPTSFGHYKTVLTPNIQVSIIVTILIVHISLDKVLVTLINN